MTATMVRTWIATFSIATAMTLYGGAAAAQTQFKPGFNLFSPDQDREIGKQSAAEAERQLPILHDQSIDAYVGRVGKRLAAVAPGAKYAYQFKVVNASDINAFALPGGYMYVNRGLIEAAQNEGQLAARARRRKRTSVRRASVFSEDSSARTTARLSRRLRRSAASA